MQKQNFSHSDMSLENSQSAPKILAIKSAEPTALLTVDFAKPASFITFNHEAVRHSRSQCRKVSEDIKLYFGQICTRAKGLAIKFAEQAALFRVEFAN